MALEPLASAAVVFRSRSHHVGTLPHVVDLVSAYLDGALPSRWSLERACANGFELRMLRRWATHEATAVATGARAPMDPHYRAYLAGKALLAAVRNDDLDAVRWVCAEYCTDVVPVAAMVEAARLGRLLLLQWLFAVHPNVAPNNHIADTAVRAGHLDVLQWMVARTPLSPEQASYLMGDAATYGHVGIVHWLHDLHSQFTHGTTALSAMEGGVDGSAIGNAIANGRFQVALFLAAHGYPFDSRDRWRLANCAALGDLAMVQWLHSQQFTRGTEGWIDVAAAAGHLHVVQWAHATLPTETLCTTEAMDRAAANGRFEIVQWLHLHRSEGCTTQAMDLAAADAHVGVLEWLHAYRTEGCTALAMDKAATNGHLHVVQWLHTHRLEGCTTRAMDGAAGSGHLHVVQWLHTHRGEGCTTTAMDTAAAGGHLDVVRWLHTHRQEGCTTWAMDGAAGNGHLHVVQWLHTHRREGCTTQAMDLAASVRLLRWLHTHRSEGCSHVAMENAAATGNFEKLLFLQKERLDTFDEQCVVEALEEHHLEIYQWLRANYLRHFHVNRVQRNYARYGGVWLMFFAFEYGRRHGPREAARATAHDR